MSETKDMVTFTNIQRSYPPGEEMAVRYLIEAGSDLKTTKRDWVGLFRVGWTSSRDYYTFEWAPEPSAETREGSVKFAGRRLPPEDGHFYQLCYVTRDGSVRGASAPFQFAPLSVSLDDMELVEITDESMKSVMVLQKKSKEEMESLRRESVESRSALNELQHQLLATQTANKNRESENEHLREQLMAAQSEVAALKTEMKPPKEEVERLQGCLEAEKTKSAEKDAQIVNLQQQLAVQNQQLGKKQDQNKEMLKVKENEEQELKVLKNRVSALEGDIVVLTSEGEDLSQQIRIKDSQVDDLQRLVGTRGEELEQVTEKLVAAEGENTQLHATCAQLRASLQQSQEETTQQQGSLRLDIDAALAKKDKYIERLEQEVACMQANIAELMGAAQHNMPPVTDQPQHSPPLPANVVDKGAYDALQSAYDNFENYYVEEKKAKEIALLQLKTAQEECARLMLSQEEMVERVLECKKQYKAKAQECIELHRRLKKDKIPSGLKSPGANKIGQMEQENEEMVRNCQTAAQELSLRRKENDERGQRIAALEEQLGQALQKAEHRYEQLQDCYDKKIAQKNEEIERQKFVFNEKAKELAEIMSERDELMAKVTQLTDSIRKPGDEGGRCCPVCNMKFPSRMSEQDFEKHVHAHFDRETV